MFGRPLTDWLFIRVEGGAARGECAYCARRPTASHIQSDMKKLVVASVGFSLVAKLCAGTEGLEGCAPAYSAIRI